MIIFDKDKKTLVIPTGLGNLNGSEEYEQGYEDGENAQKAKLASVILTANGDYSREDGWNSVTVSVPSDFPQGYNSGYTDGYAVGNEEGFAAGYPSGVTDGFSTGYESGSTDGYATGYPSGYTDGYASGTTDGYASGEAAGEAAQKAKLVSTAVTENGIYEREDGFSSISVEVSSQFPQGYASGYTDGYASGTTDGYASGEAAGQAEGFSTGYASGVTDGYASGEADGRAEGEATQRAKLDSLSVTSNGNYERWDGWSAVSVNVVPFLQTKSESLSSITATIGPNLERPTAPYGETVYGGSIDEFKDFLDTYGGSGSRIDIFSYTGPDHQDTNFEGLFQFQTYGHYYHYQSGVDYPFDDLTDSWTNAGAVKLRRIGDNVFFYVDSTYGFLFKSNEEVPASGFVFNVKNYDGLSAVTIDATAIFASGETAQMRKLTSTAITENGTYSRADGWSGVTVNVPTGDAWAACRSDIYTQGQISFNPGFGDMDFISVEFALIGNSSTGNTVIWSLGFNYEGDTLGIIIYATSSNEIRMYIRQIAWPTSPVDVAIASAITANGITNPHIRVNFGMVNDSTMWVSTTYWSESDAWRGIFSENITISKPMGNIYNMNSGVFGINRCSDIWYADRVSGVTGNSALYFYKAVGEYMFSNPFRMSYNNGTIGNGTNHDWTTKQQVSTKLSKGTLS